MNQGGSRKYPLLPLALVAGSGTALLLGLYMPAAIVFDTSPSIMVYGLVLFSFPAWLIGCIFAGVAAWLFKTRHKNHTTMYRVAWTLATLNLLSILLCQVWQPAGVS